MTEKNIDRVTQLLRDFDDMTKRVKGQLISRLGDKVKTVLQESREEYERIIPRIPSAEGKEPFTRFLISTGQYLALYKVLTKHGFTSSEAGELVYTITDKLLASYPRFLIRYLSPNIFSQEYIEKVKRGARESQQQPIGGYVFNYVNGTPDFNYGVDYTECGVHKFLMEMGTPELTPYICAMDTLHSERLGWGLKRTVTLAEGGHMCDFRFRKGKKTNVSSSLTKQV